MDIYSLQKDEFIKIADNNDIYMCEIMFIKDSTILYKVNMENDKVKYYVYTI